MWQDEVIFNRLKGVAQVWDETDIEALYHWGLMHSPLKRPSVCISVSSRKRTFAPSYALDEQRVTGGHG